MLGVGNLTLQQFINYRYFLVKEKRQRVLNVELAIALAIWYNYVTMHYTGDMPLNRLYNS